MSWTDPMIYDRTQADITSRTSKAFFNISTWLRIYGNSRVATQLVNVYLSLSVPFTELTTPTISTFPTVTEINHLIENIDLARAAAGLPVETGILPLKYDYAEGLGATTPDYQAVNAWELDIQLIRDYLRNAVDQVVHCGVASCGQAHFWQVQWSAFPFVQPAASPVRRPRCGIVACGSNLTRQNFWRKY